MQYISDNIEWIFSGIGVFIITLILSLIKFKKGSQGMVQNGKDESLNIQSGKNINININ